MERQREGQGGREGEFKGEKDRVGKEKKYRQKMKVEKDN